MADVKGLAKQLVESEKTPQEIVEFFDTNASDARTVSFEKKDYDWGTFRRIEVGLSFSIPMHPDHWEEVMKVINGASKASFEDEARKTWVVTKEGNKIKFESPVKKNYVSIETRKLQKELG